MSPRKGTFFTMHIHMMTENQRTDFNEVFLNPISLKQTKCSLKSKMVTMVVYPIFKVPSLVTMYV
jgi:hypothetical protein